jgi:hypothetical protein
MVDVKRCQESRQILNLQYFTDVLLARVLQIVIFSQLRVLPIFFSHIGFRAQKRLKNTALRAQDILKWSFVA